MDFSNLSPSAAITLVVGTLYGIGATVSMLMGKLDECRTAFMAGMFFYMLHMILRWTI